jgi:hypothetical protein
MDDLTELKALKAKMRTSAVHIHLFVHITSGEWGTSVLGTTRT